MAEHIAVDPKALVDGERPLFNTSYGKLMMWFFLVSDAFTFSSLLITYGSLRIAANAEGRLWANPEKVFTHFPGLYEWFGIEAPLAFVGLMTFILIISSVTMVLAVEAGHRNSKAEVVKWMFWTVIGGATFVACQGYEWYHFIHGMEGGGLTFGETHGEHGHHAAHNAASYTAYLTTARTVVFEQKDGSVTDAAGKVLDTKVAETALNGAKNLSKDDYFLFNIPSYLVIEYVEGGGSYEKIAESLRVPKSDGFAEITSLQLSHRGELVVDKASIRAILRMAKPTHGGANMYANEYGPKAFANLFFFVTGFHGTHVFSGVIINIIILLNAIGGTYERRGHYEMIEKVGLYWHFVDLVWVFVFTLFYLL